MRRGFWFVAGAGAGVYATVRARRAVESLTPDGLRDRAAGLSLGAHLFGAEVRSGMAEKEAELRDRLGWTSGAPQLEPSDLSPADLSTTDLSTADPSTAERERELT